jgi:hypothetical protein
MSAPPANSPVSFSSRSALSHLLIPFAACSAPAWLPTMQALPRDSTRHLSQLLQGMKPIHTDAGDAQALSPPHERALARAQGLISDAGVDGLIPWAAADAAKHLQADSTRAWAWITPCHWAMGRGHATLSDPAALALPEDESRALLAAMQPYFETDGITLHYADALGPQRWLAEGELFRHLPTASLDRVLGRNVDAWLPSAAHAERRAGPPQASSAPPGGSAAHAVASVGAKTLRRLQNEMQMLLYTHPLNDARVRQLQLPVNSIWISGSGALPALLTTPEDVSVPRSLAQAVFADDWDAYAQASAQLDAGAVAQLLARQQAGEAVRLTLCGERSAQTWQTSRNGLFSRISSFLAPKPLWDGLQQL